MSMRAPWQVAERLALAAGLALGAAGMVGAAPPPAPSGSATPPVLRVVADYWCPYSCRPDDAHRGYLVDVMTAVFEPLGYRVDYRVLPWRRAARQVRLGQADAALGVARDAEDMIIPAASAAGDVSAFAVRIDDPWRWQGLPSLAGRQLAVVNDYGYSPALDAWIQGEGRARGWVQGVGLANALQINLEKLRNRRVDAVLDNLGVLRQHLRANPDPGFRIEGSVPGTAVTVGFSPRTPNGPVLARAFSAGLERLRASGELARLQNRYGVPPVEALHAGR